MKKSKIFKAVAILAFGLCATNAMADACSEQGGHTGSGKTTQGQNNSSVTGNIGSTGYHYEIWYQGGNNSMTYYDDGTFKASWNGTNDFLARVGFKYNETQTHDQIGQLDADFKFTKQGSAGGYSYIGIYGWTVDPLVEYYIVDDWFNKPGAYLGQKKGEITVDGETYDIYQNTRNQQPSIKGTSTFPQYFSVRRNARQCGHIDLTAHFKKWESLGMKMGKMYEAKFLVEAGGGSGSFDATYFKMTQGGKDAAKSSSSAAKPDTPKSSSSTKGGDIKVSTDFCSNAQHSGDKKTVNNSNVGKIGDVGYELWYDRAQQGSATFYSDGSMSCSFQSAGDYLCRSGLSFNSDKTYKELGGDMLAEFKLVKQNVSGADYSYVGVYGWMEDTPGEHPLVEYYVVDNWLSQYKPGDWVGNKKYGDYTIDGAKYTVYSNVRTGPAIKTNGNATFWQYFSIRESARDCGVINISAHMRKWEELGMKMGKLYEAKVLGEAGSNGGGVSGTADFPHAKVYVYKDTPAPASSASVDPKSSDSKMSSSSEKSALPVAAKFTATEGNFKVFDMQGRFMGEIKLSQGARITDVLMARFNKAGVYLLKNGAFMQAVSVIK